MDILQRVLDTIEETIDNDNIPFVDNIAKRRKKCQQKLQHTDNIENIKKGHPIKLANNHQNPDFDQHVTTQKHTESLQRAKSVVNVACIQGNKELLKPSSSSKNYKKNIPLLYTSNNVNKCESCPAGGFWDYIGPGMFCFHRAYYLGKSGKPVLCAVAKNSCPLDG